jgi:hypothetical protein
VAETGDFADPCWNCQPSCSWQVWAGALFLNRSRASQQALVYDPPKEGVVYDASQLDLGVSWGPAVGISYCLDACSRVGVEFFAIDNWSTTSQTAGNISVEFPSFSAYLPDPTIPGDPNSGFGVVTFDYTSRLYNTELNLYRRSRDFCWLTTLVGFRYLEVGEDLHTVFVTGDSAPHYTIRAANQLYGVQLGTLAYLQDWGSWRFDGWLKAGVYGNAARQSMTEDITSAGGVVTFGTANGSNVAFVGDLGVSATRPITDRLSLKLSYMALWIEGIALAPAQLAVSEPANAIFGLHQSGGSFYHGGFLGCEYRW